MLNAGPEYREPFRAEACSSLGAVPAHQLASLRVEGTLGPGYKYKEQ